MEVRLGPNPFGIGFAVVGATVTVCGLAAEKAPPRVRITYTAQGACPTEAEFREAVRQRAPELDDAKEGEPAREFAAEAVELAAGARGTVVISDPSGATVTRRLDGNDCREVTEALAFIVAELGRALHVDSDVPTTTPSARPAPLASGPARSPRSALDPPAEPNLAPRTVWEGGAGMEAIFAPAPDWAFAPFAYVEVGRARRGEPALFSGRLSLSYAKSGTIHAVSGEAEIRLFVGRGELCGPELGGNVLAFGGCASIELGELEGRGSGSTLAPKTESALWLAPGLAARGRWTLEQRLVVGLEAHAFVPLVRPSFYFGGGASGAEPETIHAVPAVGFRAAASLGVRFP